MGCSLVVQWLGLSTFTAMARFQSLAGEISKGRGTAKKEKKKKKSKHGTVGGYLVNRDPFLGTSVDITAKHDNSCLKL